MTTTLVIVRLALAAMVAIGFIASVPHPSAQAQPPQDAKYLNPDLSIADRVRDLVSRMTLEEKVSQLQHGARAIERLGVPAYNWWNEGLHGVARAGRATVFPQAIGLAATWNAALMNRIAAAISDEARAKHHEFVRRGQHGLYQGLTFWSPNINIFRDPRWGRGMETYGEDPYLVGRLAVAFVKGMQGDDAVYLKTVATPKHFAVHSGPESERHVFDAVVDPRDLRDTYLAQFEMAVREGGAFSVMCAYNRYLGEPACASPALLETILRREWGFGGYVVSDCGAIDDISMTHKLVKTPAEASAISLKAGCDLSCGTTYAALADAVKQGLVNERDLDVSLERLFTARVRLGMFDSPARVRYAQTPITVVDRPEHQSLALEAARQSIVLLKNEPRVLPLRKNAGTIAVIGPNADDEEVLLGNYNGTPTKSVTILEGIRRKVGTSSKVLFAQGADWADGVSSFDVVPASALRTTESGRAVQGLTGEYFNPGQAVTAQKGLSWDSATLRFPDLAGQPVFTRIDATLDKHWFDAAPDPRLPEDGFAIRWTGELVPPVTGSYQLGGYGLTGFRLYLDDKLLIEFRSNHEPSKKSKRVDLEAGKARRIRVEYFDRSADARFQLLWTRPDRQLQEHALSIAKQADVIVAVMGLSPRLEGEEMEVPVAGFKGGDRLTLDLPAAQQQLLERFTAFGKPVVLVLVNGSAVAVNWASDHVPAILEAWYPGQAAGTASGRRAVRRCEPGRTAAGDLLQVGRRHPRVFRLSNGRPNLPVLQGRAAVPVRLRPELHPFRLPGSRGSCLGARRAGYCGVDRSRKRREGSGRRGRPAVCHAPEVVSAGSDSIARRLRAGDARSGRTADGALHSRSAPALGDRR